MKNFYNKISLLFLATVYAIQLLATTHTVQVSNFSFTPSNVNAVVGDTMHWVWVGGSHTTTCDGSIYTVLPAGAPSWNSSINSGNPTFDYVITVAGSYTYKCTPHAPSMVGTINAIPPPNPFVNVTFRVDLSLQTVCPGGVHLAGAFNGWSATATPMTDIGGSVYEVTLSLDSTQTYEYKFLKDSAFSVCGDETVPAACNVNGNRQLVVPNSDSVLPTVCFGSCSACVIPGYADITFRVDMTNETIAAGGVHLTGSFNGWSATATPMTDIGGNVYEATVNIDTSFTVQYTFLKDSTFSGQEIVPATCGVPNGFGGYNRELVMPENDSTLATVCFSSCSACANLTQVNVTFRVDISQETPCPGGPYLVGSFNGFNATATPMTAVGAGVYEATLLLDTGAVVQYKFLKDSTYSCGDETVPAACGVPNGFGGYNREFTVGVSDTALATVCFSSCSACVPVVATVNVTFNVDMSQTTLGPGGPHIAGTFNNFFANVDAMTAAGGGIYTFTVALDSTQIIQYTFLKDSTYNGQEVISSACGVPNGFGGYNRFIDVPETDTILPPFCYGSCTVCVNAINDFDNTELSIYPNPATDELIVETNLSQNATLKLISLDGRLLLQQSAAPGPAKHQFILSKYSKGVYALQIESGETTTTKKIIVQ